MNDGMMSGALTRESLSRMANCSDPLCISESDFNGFMEHPMWGCDGNPNVHPGGGNWLGELAPEAATE